MADTVTTQVIFDGSKKAILKFTNISDGTGESAVVKVDVSTLVDAPTKVTINKIWFSADGMAVKLLWDADADVLVYIIPSNQNGFLDFSSFAGIHNNAGVGVTGDLVFTTVGHSAGDSYSIILEVIKN